MKRFLKVISEVTLEELRSRGLITSTVDMPLNGPHLNYWISKGYIIEPSKTQVYQINPATGNANKDGCRISVPRGSILAVRVEDLPRTSGVKVQYKCSVCGCIITTTYKRFLDKMSDACPSCHAKIMNAERIPERSQNYYLKTLIADNPNAKCEITGESDKRFLDLHHKLSRSNGGMNHPDNYAIVSTQYHHIFHREMGGNNKLCTPQQWEEFKQKEITRLEGK